ncbi:efflux RND transporter periplasmic adaptor subunit [Endozoicomonas sp. GU-1]|uniref:efflux RND transporter periplasmic adaptor subunit n=1 Tax=Endozoicomonas sp. GU-1 TaxID=3009078 RepID=UPI0022B38763|nr:efflux RND transporter periplasmic adaptor subunit [Endozoicomonas sp. GU-1]WBA80121.1 efflux RND transporter periplasmic adaptor subunit [Endozoicomonas sp. GU-1]WBA87696.1 efflux RND transporter periplasmic adaptor subunit [Endozoicomonas sp. GU-1]
MSGSLFSSSWYKVADLKVRLRKHAHIHRHVYRDNVWYVLQDHVTGQFHRFKPAAYQMIALMDGTRTLQQIWEIACEELGDNLPTQDEVIQLVGQLNKANVIQTDKLPDIDQLQKQRSKVIRNQWLQQIKSPLSIRIPLVDPEAFLSATSPIATAIFSRLGAIFFLFIILLGGVLAITHWEPLTENLSDRLLATENLLLMALVYPFVKLIHELGHAYAVKRWGGEVHEMGVMLLVMFPVPYVDASAACSFHNKYQRMIVGAVGILGELLMSAIAMIIWASVEPGVVRALAFNVMLIGGFSTLLFNGNPLLRFDAYYVLADYLEIPNLAARGNAQLGYLVKQYLLKVQGLKSVTQSRSESIWLVGYAVLSYIYRLFVMVAISLLVASKYLFIGVLLACWSIWSSLLAPITKMIAKPVSDPQLWHKRKAIYLYSCICAGLVLSLLLMIPMPYQTYSQGVVYIPQEAIIRAPANGFIEKQWAETGSEVSAGDSIFTMDAPELMAREKVLTAQASEARLRYQAAIDDRTQSDILSQEVQFINNELLEARERIRALTINGVTDGELVVIDRSGIDGKYFQRGDVLGYIVNYDHLPLTTVISESDIDQVRNQTKQVSLKFSSSPNQEYHAEIIRQHPSSTHILPSHTLSTEGGGLIALAPDREYELQSYQGYFRVDIEAENAPRQRFDERLHVLFEHDPEPLFWRWYRDIRRLFLRQFDV